MNELKSLEIWIVDDDPLYSPALKKILEQDVDGATICHYSTGNEVLKALSTGQRPATVVLDMMLPMEPSDTNGGLPPGVGKKANGAIVAEALLKEGVLPAAVVVITALSEESYHEPLIKLGIPKSNILTKPARVDEIKRVVKQSFSGARKT